MSSVGLPDRTGRSSRTGVPVLSARAEASRQNGAKSRGPRTEEGKARSAQNALKHGLRAQKYLVLPEEDGAEFAALEAALVEELAPVGALQTLLTRRVAIAAWRLARADRLEAEVLEFRSYEGANAGLALIRDGNGTRSFETLLRYRGAAMAEFWRALKTLKALQAEPAREAGQAHEAGKALEDGPAPTKRPLRRAARPPIAHRPRPNEPERGGGRRLDYLPSTPPAPARVLHEPAAPWRPNEPETQGSARLKQPQLPAEPTVPAGPLCSTHGEHRERTA